MTGRNWLTVVLTILCSAGVDGAVAAADWVVKQDAGQLTISFKSQPIAAYVFNDQKIKRPYFTDLRTLQDRRLTRNHPPVAGQDREDHAEMHPGLWLAFGDLSGHDFWRNRANATHVRFVDRPRVDDNGAEFTVENVYEANGQPLCREHCRIQFTRHSLGYLIHWSSSFEPIGTAVNFGDQEEMGLGVRLHTPLTVEHGGRILNSDGGLGEAAAWGKQADWCEYSGVIDGRRVGVAILPSPTNFRRSWFHVRDYGLMVANPFGRNAFTKEAKSSVEIRKGETLKLQFRVLAFDVHADTEPDIAVEYRAYLGNDMRE